ncbi:Pentatricopeptide repeat [Dillenia turbinata]|uniref:Pentatricopeptide repeat n=1 Tax=Dillenia turbinata TaxID=194707 RepID=A0AAN8UKI2_9MAGN
MRWTSCKKSRGFLQDDNVLVDMVHKFCGLEKRNETLWFLEDKNVLETRPHNVLLEGCCDASKFLAAIDLLEKKLERNMANVTSWNILLRCFDENAWTKKAFELLGRMTVRSFVSDSGTYSAFISSKCNLNDMRMLWSSFTGLVLKKRLVLEPFVLNTLILGLCMKREVEKTIRLRSLAYCSGTYCPTSTFNAIMLALYKSDNVNDLLAVFSQMLVEGCPLEKEVHGLIPLSVIAQANHFELHIIWAAIETLASTCEVIDSAMYNKQIDGLLKEGYKNEARGLLDIM